MSKDADDALVSAHRPPREGGERKEAMTAKRFYLNRLIDESGMSGLGRVAEGVELPNGMCVMWWLVPPHSIQQYRSIEDLHFIHRHGEKKTTELVWEAP